MMNAELRFMQYLFPCLTQCADAITTDSGETVTKNQFSAEDDHCIPSERQCVLSSSLQISAPRPFRVMKHGRTQVGVDSLLK